jgi:isopropylmalate/homocitrate/citramalate synthase
MSTCVKIVEVGPRDGLQNESHPVTTDQKVHLIQELAKAGCSVIEAGGFVSPKWVPQMADSTKVLEQLSFPSTSSRPLLSCLVPNLQGLEKVLRVKHVVDEIAIFGAASEEFSQRNIACSIDESMKRFQAVVEAAKQSEIPVRGYVSTVVACPYQGPVAPSQVAKVVEQMIDLGCHEISLGDTIGVGTPGSIRSMLDDVLVSLVFGCFCSCRLFLIVSPFSIFHAVGGKTVATCIALP